MEGITTYCYRQLHNKFFGGVDKYFTPFISVFPDHYIKKRDEREIDPSNNIGMKVVPQVLANSSAEFIWIFKKLISMGYDEVNLNLGCPSGTVTAKGRGSGFLRDIEKLENFFDEVFDALSENARALSVKTRIGYNDISEMEQLSRIYAKYPIKELTIHPRLRKQFYKGTPYMDVFEKALVASSCPVCYNGNVFTKEDYDNIYQKYGYHDNTISNNAGSKDNKISSVMLGRGLVADPSLARVIKGGERMTKQEFQDFRRSLEDMYKETLKDGHNVFNKMKEMWYYMSQSYENSDAYIKNILKSKSFAQYQAAVNTLEGNCELKNGPYASNIHFG